jgi:Ca2+-binding EF-hand superfamily protein
MGCVKSTAANPQQASTSLPVVSAEQKVTVLFRDLFDSTGLDSDKTIDKIELQAALEKNEQLPALIIEAKFNPYAQKLDKLDTNRDGRVSWEEFEKHFTKVAAEEKADTRLGEIFNSIDANNDGVVDKDELATKLKAEDGKALTTLLEQSGVKTDNVFEQLDANKDGKVSLDEFHNQLKEAATDEVLKNGDVVPAIQIEDEKASNNTSSWCSCKA